MIGIKLDSSALNTLFPEGSEARLELAQATIEEFTKRKIRGLGAEALTTIEARFTKAEERIHQEIKALFLHKSSVWSNQFDLKPEIKTKIKDQIIQSTDSEIRKIISEEIRSKLKNLEPFIEATIKSRLEHLTTQLSDKAIKDLLDQKLQKALEALK